MNANPRSTPSKFDVLTQVSGLRFQVFGLIVALILAAFEEAIKYAPDALAAYQRVAAIIANSGHPDLTPADIAALQSFGAKTSEQYLTDAGGAPAAPALTATA